MSYATVSAPSLPMPAAVTLGDRAERLIPIAIAAIVLAVAITTVSPWPVGAFEDDAIYTILGKSLAEGHGYRLINLPGAPNATHFPPGYPALLAVLWRLGPAFPDNLVLFKFANALLLALAAVGTYLFALRRLTFSRTASAVVALAGTLSVVVLLLTGLVLSEPLFLALLVPTLLAAERAADTGFRRHAVVAGLLLGALALVRTLGMFVIPGTLVLLLCRRRYAGAAALAIGAALLLVPWQLFVALHQHEVPPVIAGKYGSYVAWAVRGYADGGPAFMWDVVVANSQRVFNMLSYLHAPVATLWPRLIAFAVLMGLLVVGAIRLTPRAPVTLSFVVVYLGVVLIWPFEPDRFLIGIWPVLALCIALGVRTMVQWQPARPAARSVRLAVLALCVGVAIGYATYNGRGYQNSWWTPYQRRAGERMKPIVEWVAHNTAMDDVIATDHDPAVYLYTGRRAVPTTTWTARELVQPRTPEEESRAARAILAQLRPRFFVPTSLPGLRVATELANASPQMLRYVGPLPNGAAFIIVRQ